MMNATQNKNIIGNDSPSQLAHKPKTASFEPLEDRRLMSQVSLVDGMLVLQGNAHGNNRLTVSPDSNGTTCYARANKEKAHYLLKDVKSIRIVGGEKRDVVEIDTAIKKSSYIKT